MQHRSLTYPSSTPRDTKESRQWIKARPNCIQHLLQMVVIKVLKWHWPTVTGQVLAPRKAANVHWLGTGVQLNNVCFTMIHCLPELKYVPVFTSAMNKFISGPPGGRTLPQTATRLSDLAGGIYGPGASVASTGLNTHRPAIKAGIARAAGETWEDVLEYYLVRHFFAVPDTKYIFVQ